MILPPSSPHTGLTASGLGPAQRPACRIPGGTACLLVNKKPPRQAEAWGQGSANPPPMVHDGEASGEHLTHMATSRLRWGAHHMTMPLDARSSQLAANFIPSPQSEIDRHPSLASSDHPLM